MRALRPVIVGSSSGCEAERRAAQAYASLERIARMMLAQGAPGRPEAE